MVVEIISIVLSSLLSLIAVIISIISIKKQTKSQNINSTIALFDKRFEIYNFVLDIWYIVGYFEGSQDANKKKKHYYQEIISLVKLNGLDEDMFRKVKYAYQNSNKYLRMQSCLFSGKVSDYLEKLLSNFSTYIHGIYHGLSIGKDIEEPAYNELLKLHKTEEIDMEELRQYIDLSDIKRLDI